MKAPIPRKLAAKLSFDCCKLVLTYKHLVLAYSFKKDK